MSHCMTQDNFSQPVSRFRVSLQDNRCERRIGSIAAFRMPMIRLPEWPDCAILEPTYPSHRSLLRKVTCIKDGFFSALCSPSTREAVA